MHVHVCMKVQQVHHYNCIHLIPMLVEEAIVRRLKGRASHQCGCLGLATSVDRLKGCMWVPDTIT